jgi:HK97 family phage portal protein
LSNRRWYWPFERRALAEDVRGNEVADPFMGWTYSDVNVTPDRAFGLSAFYACVRLLATGLMVPAAVTRSIDGVETPVRVNPASRLLEEGPNEDLTHDHWVALVVAQLCGWGNHFSAKDFHPSTGMLQALWPIHPSRVTVYRDAQGRKRFSIDGKQGFTSDHILHIPYIDFATGLMGHSPVSVMRHRLGVGIAASDTQARLFNQGTLTSMALRHPGTLSTGAADRLRGQWQSRYAGGKNAHKPVLLEEGMEAQPLSMNPKDQQFIEQLQMSDVETARMFNIPARRIDAQVQYSLTYATGAMDDNSTVKWAHRPIARMIEASLQKDPHFIPRGRQFGVRFNLDAMLRADIKTRAEVADLFARAGVRTPNDSRRHENLAAHPDGDELGTGGGVGELERAEALGISAQRLGLASHYGVLSAEEARDILPAEELNGPAPDRDRREL